MKRHSTLVKLIAYDIIAIVTALVSFVLFRQTGAGWLLSLYVTFLTISYHFTVRLAVGQAMILYYKKRPPRQGSLMTRTSDIEQKLYRRLNVKSWKNRLITARPEQFDIKERTPEEMLRSMVQAETGHIINMPLSFLPLLLIIPYGTAPVFIITSVLACLMEVPFVIIQRYNMPRMIRYIRLTERRGR